MMEEIKSMLHLDVMTVTGKTLGENLEELKKNGFYEHCDEILREKSKLLEEQLTERISSIPLTMPREQTEVLQFLKEIWHLRAV